MAEIVDRASTSQRTFYEHFANKEEALLAALDAGSAQWLANTLPAFRRAPDWQHAVRGAYEGMFAFGVEEPEYSRLGAVEMYAAGKRALETRDRIMEQLEALLAPGYELAPETPPIAAEAIGGAIYALVYDQVKAKGPESLPELVPMSTYMTLAPFLGAEEAYELAVGSGGAASLGGGGVRDALRFLIAEVGREDDLHQLRRELLQPLDLARAEASADDRGHRADQRRLGQLARDARSRRTRLRPARRRLGEPLLSRERGAHQLRLREPCGRRAATRRASLGDSAANSRARADRGGDAVGPGETAPNRPRRSSR